MSLCKPHIITLIFCTLGRHFEAAVAKYKAYHAWPDSAEATETSDMEVNFAGELKYLKPDHPEQPLGARPVKP